MTGFERPIDIKQNTTEIKKILLRRERKMLQSKEIRLGLTKSVRSQNRPRIPLNKNFRHGEFTDNKIHSL
jgi:hypothetical protein